MPANVRFIFENVADDAALSCSPAEVATLPASNLQLQTRGDVWRSDGVISAQHILGDLAGFNTLSAMALVRHNLTAAANYRLRLYQGAGQSGTLVYDSGTVTPNGERLGWGVFRWGIDPWGAASLRDWPVPYFVAWFAPVVALSFDLELTDTANLNGFLQAARLVIGNYVEPTYNFSYRHPMSWREQSKQARTEGGTLRTDERQAFRRFRFALDHLTADERTTFLDYFRRAGLRNDLFVSCYPTRGGSLERDHAGVVKLVEIPEMDSDHYLNYLTALVLEDA